MSVNNALQDFIIEVLSVFGLGMEASLKSPSSFIDSLYRFIKNYRFTHEETTSDGDTATHIFKCTSNLTHESFRLEYKVTHTGRVISMNVLD